MGKYLDLLLNFENTQNTHTQKHQKGGNGAFEGFEGGHSEQIENYPAVWRVVLRGTGRDYAMTVIDPERMPDDKFLHYLGEKFGAGRVVDTERKKR